MILYIHFFFFITYHQNTFPIDESEKDNEQVIKPDTKNTDKNIELAQESLIKSISPPSYDNLKSSLVTSMDVLFKWPHNLIIFIDKFPNHNSNFNENLANQKVGSFKVKTEKGTSPNNQMNLTNLKTNSNSGSGSNKNLTAASQLNNQGFSSKIANVDNLSSLKKNIDMNNFNINQTSHLKSNNTQNLAKGLSRLNDNKAPGEGPSFEKTNFTTSAYGKYPAGKYTAKDFK